MPSISWMLGCNRNQPPQLELIDYTWGLVLSHFWVTVQSQVHFQVSKRVNLLPSNQFRGSLMRWSLWQSHMSACAHAHTSWETVWLNKTNPPSLMCLFFTQWTVKKEKYNVSGVCVALFKCCSLEGSCRRLAQSSGSSVFSLHLKSPFRKCTAWIFMDLIFSSQCR